jgi:hypothetical protein
MLPIQITEDKLMDLYVDMIKTREQLTFLQYIMTDWNQQQMD